MGEKTDMGKYASILISHVLALTLGFGGSQMLAVQALRDRVIAVEHQSSDNAKEIDHMQIAFENRMNNAVKLMETLAKQVGEVVTLLKLQQQVKAP